MTDSQNHRQYQDANDRRCPAVPGKGCHSPLFRSFRQEDYTKALIDAIPKVDLGPIDEADAPADGTEVEA